MGSYPPVNPSNARLCLTTPPHQKRNRVESKSLLLFPSLQHQGSIAKFSNRLPLSLRQVITLVHNQLLVMTASPMLPRNVGDFPLLLAINQDGPGALRSTTITSHTVLLEQTHVECWVNAPKPLRQRQTVGNRSYPSHNLKKTQPMLRQLARAKQNQVVCTQPTLLTNIKLNQMMAAS